nr:hypothetical protein [Morchella crassipes]
MGCSYPPPLSSHGPPSHHITPPVYLPHLWWGGAGGVKRSDGGKRWERGPLPGHSPPPPGSEAVTLNCGLLPPHLGLHATRPGGWIIVWDLPTRRRLSSRWQRQEKIRKG